MKLKDILNEGKKPVNEDVEYRDVDGLLDKAAKDFDGRWSSEHLTNWHKSAVDSIDTIINIYNRAANIDSGYNNGKFIRALDKDLKPLKVALAALKKVPLS